MELYTYISKIMCACFVGVEIMLCPCCNHQAVLLQLTHRQTFATVSAFNLETAFVNATIIFKAAIAGNFRTTFESINLIVFTYGNNNK